ncbi:MAG TPA: hypothetical protein VEM57_00180 [Candidatus Binatus sp.]|nr:hypothetical protein [Candidatus Binatus sp.]
MRIIGRWAVGVAVLAGVLAAAGVARADNNPNGTVFRAVGWFGGKGEITPQAIKCETPTISSAIAEGAFSFGMWNTYGVQTLFYPDINNPFGNPCGGWIQLQNNLTDQAIQLDHFELRYKIPNAARYRGSVPTRNSFPIACRELRRDSMFVGAVINPITSKQDQSGSGSPNVTFIQMLPLVTPQMIYCMRGQYAPLDPNTFVSLPLVIRATGVGFSDSGAEYRTNTIAYHLTLRHSCGNGRVDDGELCDPAAPFTCAGFCVIPPGAPNGTCSNESRRLCRADPDCQGTCNPPNNPTECVCVY